MIIRFVKMGFKPEEIENFKNLFEQTKNNIRNMPGCYFLSLYSELNSNVMYTHSIWNSIDDLEHYRNSDLFETTWAKTKVLFNQKPEAWTVELSSTTDHNIFNQIIVK